MTSKDFIDLQPNAGRWQREHDRIERTRRTIVFVARAAAIALLSLATMVSVVILAAKVSR